MRFRSFSRKRNINTLVTVTVNVQTQGTAAQLTKHKRFQRSFELSEGDVRLPKLFRLAVPQRWPGDDKTAVTEVPLYRRTFSPCLSDANTAVRKLK